MEKTMTNTEKLAAGYVYRGECHLSPWNTQLLLGGTATGRNPVNLGNGFVAVAHPMPPRRRVSIEEFEADMRAIRKASR